LKKNCSQSKNCEELFSLLLLLLYGKNDFAEVSENLVRYRSEVGQKTILLSK